MKPRFADVALRAPAQLLTYEVPATLLPLVERGARVLVPVRRTRQAAVVWRLHDKAPLESAREILDVLDATPLFGEPLLELAEWLSAYYHAGLGETLFAMLPAGLKPEIDTQYRHYPERVPTGRLTPSEKKLCFFIAENPGATRRELMSQFPATDTSRRLEKLVAAGTVVPVQKFRATKSTGLATAVQWNEAGTDPEPSPLSLYLRSEARPVFTWELESRFPGSARQVLKLARRRLVSRVRLPAPYRPTLSQAPAAEPLKLSAAQDEAVKAITRSFGTHRTFLLYGITGSGKTEVYIRCISEVLERGQSVLFLVPEIGLADHLLGRLAPHFESQVVLLHSGLSDAQRAQAWRAAASGTRRLVVGTRSASLVPIANLGLVVVDEEQDPSLKQAEPAPRYHGRDVAIWRAHQSSAVCVLGSATPSLESWHNAHTGKYDLLRLPERIGGGRLPSLELIDRRHSAPAAPGGTVTGVLAAHIRSALARGEQCILFLNRRGFSGSLRCAACGTSPECPDCSVSFTFHRERRQLRCHYCGRTEPAPSVCAGCGASTHTYPRAGTQQVESELSALFPTARIARLDLDTAAAGGSQKLLAEFGRHEIDILLGTQMVTKGLHFPRVSLVGILNTDMALDRPDFRAAERTLQQMLQVAGRAGRGDVPGSVYAQTFSPESPLLQEARRHDYETFAKGELTTRETLGFPPFSRAIVVWVEAEDEAQAEAQATELAQRIRTAGTKGFRLLGPAPAPIRKLRRRYRWHFLLLTGRVTQTLSTLDRALEAGVPRQVRVYADVDPVHVA